MAKNYLKVLSLLALFSICFSGYAQTIENHLTALQESYKFEKISIHTDKLFYLAGDTIWLKAYVMADGNPSLESSKMSINLVNDSNKAVIKLILPVLFSSASASMQLPNDMPAGTYSLQAFTDYMAVRDKQNFYNRSIEIANITTAVKTKEISFQPKVEFFPEAGFIIKGIYNSIAMKCTDQFGYPINAKGVLVDANGSAISSFEASHDGMGKLRIKPLTNEVYQAKISFDNGTEETFPLPKISSSGIGFESSIALQEIVAEVNCSQLINESQRPTLMLITQNNILVAKNELPARELLTLRIPTSKLATGIIKLTLFSAEQKPLIERIYFINNDNYSSTGVFNVIKKSLTAKGKQTYQIAVNDTLNTNLSISVLDAAYDSSSISYNNIISDLLLTEELKGYIHYPSQYFLQNDIVSKRNVDLVMMTNGWRRYNWDKILSGYLPKFPEVKKGFLSFEGQLLDKTTKTAIDGGNLTTIFKNKKGILGNINIPIDSNGRFALSDLIANDSLNIDILGIYNKYQKKIDFRDLDMSITSLPISAGLTISPLSTGKNSSIFKIPADRMKYYNDLGIGKVITLDNIKIEANKRWENTSEVNDRYTAGTLFNSGEVISYDYVSEPITGNTTQNLFSYATGRFAGITLGRSGGREFFIFRNTFSLTGGSLPMTIVVDNVEVPTSVLRTIPMKDIALVKIYSANLLFSTQAGGVMAVFTKRGSDNNGQTPSSSVMTINLEGYSYVKEFYSPDDLAIEKARIKNIPDNRSTIYWNPMVQLNEESKSINLSFYNSDRATKHRVIIQGFNSAGKLFYLEKIIE